MIHIVYPSILVNSLLPPAEEIQIIINRLKISLNEGPIKQNAESIALYPGGKGPLFMGATLGIVAEALAPCLGTLAVCEELDVAALAFNSFC